MPPEQDTDLCRALQPTRLGGLHLRNRVVKTATYEGMSPAGVPSARLVRHHRDLAEGGVGLTTVAYCAVSDEGRTFSEQLYVHDAAAPGLRKVVDAVHAAGGAASLQLGHCGFFSKHRSASGRWPRGPSLCLNAYGLMAGRPLAFAMSRADIDGVVGDFGCAAEFAIAVGFDAVELHLGHGYLLSQFLCPATNRRRDSFGGSLSNRLRFPLAVVSKVREVAGPDFPILVKINLDDGFKAGLHVDEAVLVAKALEHSGVDALVLSGGFVSRSAMFLMRGERPLRQMIEVERNLLQKAALALFGPLLVRKVPFEELFFLPLARRLRAAVKMPLVLLGGIVSGANIAVAMAEGFDFVAMGRALIADPDFVLQLEASSSARTRCKPCNECMAEMDRPTGVRCVLETPETGLSR